MNDNTDTDEMEIQFATACDDERVERGEVVERTDEIVRINPGETRPDFELRVPTGAVTMIATPHFPDERFRAFGTNGRVVGGED